MTKDYAYDMWLNYLKRMQETNSLRINKNPAVQFKKDSENGRYRSYSKEKYETLAENIHQESALFRDDDNASAYTLFLRGFQALQLMDDELEEIAVILACASDRLDPGYGQEDKQLIPNVTF